MFWGLTRDRGSQTWDALRELSLYLPGHLVSFACLGLLLARELEVRGPVEAFAKQLWTTVRKDLGGGEDDETIGMACHLRDEMKLLRGGRRRTSA